MFVYNKKSRIASLLVSFILILPKLWDANTIIPFLSLASSGSFRFLFVFSNFSVNQMIQFCDPGTPFIHAVNFHLCVRE